MKMTSVHKTSSKMRAYKAKWSRENRKKNLEKIRRFNREWVMARRMKWLNENGPCKVCNSWTRLEVDHINPKTKVHHSIWTWSEFRRLKELKKCQVLCFVCHRLKTHAERGWKLHGTLMYLRGCRCNECIRVYKKKLRTEELRKL